MNLNKLLKLAKQNPIITGFGLIFLIVILISFTKLLTPDLTPIFVKVKLGQGLWWARTDNPKIWFTKALKKGEKEYNLLGAPIAEILEVRYYPYKTEGRDDTLYDIYLTINLAANESGKTKKFVFKRSPVLVGTPIELEFQSTQVTGAITAISEKPFDDNYIEKVIYLSKRFAFPWEYEAIKIGDKFFDGEDIVFEVLDKNQTRTAIIAPDRYGNFTAANTDSTRYLNVKAKIVVKEDNGRIIFGEEQVLIPGTLIDISTDNFDFNGFVLAKIE